MHHIIFDGWSVTVLLQELSELYEAFINNRPSTLQDLTTQYSDYVSWQQKHLTDELFQNQLTYWKKSTPRLSACARTADDILTSSNTNF